MKKRNQLTLEATLFEAPEPVKCGTGGGTTYWI